MAIPIVPEWSLGDRLRKARTVAGLSIEQLAVVISTTAKTVHKYEHDIVKKPNGALVARWAYATNVSAAWLYAGFGGDPVLPEETRNLDWGYVFGGPAQLSFDLRQPDAVVHPLPRRDRRRRQVPVACDRRHHEPFNLGLTG